MAGLRTYLVTPLRVLMPYWTGGFVLDSCAICLAALHKTTMLVVPHRCGDSHKAYNTYCVTCGSPIYDQALAIHYREEYDRCGERPH